MGFVSILSQGPGSLIADPTEASVGAMSGLAQHPALNGADTGLSTLLTNIQTHMAAELQGLTTKLPLLAAVESVQKRVAMLDGVKPGTDGGSLMSTAFRSVTSLGPILSGVHAQLANILSSAPIPDLAHPSSATSDSVSSLVAAAQGQFSSLVSSEQGAYTQGLEMLRSFSFASFLASPQSPAIQKILSSCVTIPTGLKVDKALLAAGTPAMQGTVIPETPMFTKSPADIAPTPAKELPAPVSNPAAFTTSRTSAHAAGEAYYAARQAAIDAQHAAADWQEAHDYQAVEARGTGAAASSEDKAAYDRLYAQFKAGPWEVWHAKILVFEAARSEWNKKRLEYVDSEK